MNATKDKQVFKDTLTGKTIARDCFDTPMIEGEIILHATGGTTAEMRVLKILEVINKDKSHWFSGKNISSVQVILKVRRATRGWGNKKPWTLQKTVSRITTLKNCVVITNPKPEILELFKDVV